MQQANHKKDEKCSCLSWGRSEGPDDGSTLISHDIAILQGPEAVPMCTLILTGLRGDFFLRKG